MIRKVSIISPVYNVEKYLPKFIKTIKAQTLKNWELILVDDGSTDKSLKICNEASNDDSRIKVVHQSNMGSGAARNTGLKIATGKYVYFCDPDDYLDKNLLQDNYELAEEHQSELVIFGYYKEDNKGDVLETVCPSNRIYTNKSDIINLFPKLFAEPIVYYVWNKLYLRKTLDNIFFSTSHTGQDFRFNLKLFSSLSNVYCNNKPYYHYLSNRAGSAQNAKTQIKKISKLYDLNKENEELYFLVFFAWNKYNNIELINLIKFRYLDVYKLSLRIIARLPVKKKKDILNNIYIQNKYTERVLKSYSHVGLKDKYVLTLVKYRNSNFIWYCDKVVRTVWNLSKGI